MSRQVPISILFILSSLAFFPLTSWGYCSENEYFGITSEKPLMSTIDVSSTTFYSTTSTSGTSGCPNWDFTQHLEESRKKFLNNHYQQLLEEASQGKGSHLEVLGRLIGCPPSHDFQFARLLKHNYAPMTKHFSVSKHPNTAAFLVDLKYWVAENFQLKNSCKMTG